MHAATRKDSAPAVPGKEGASDCAAFAERPALAAICARDGAFPSLRARFRSSVEIAGERRDAEGVLARRGDAMRIKLFTLAGLTVYDALWVGEPGGVRGHVELPLANRSIDAHASATEPVSDPEVSLSLTLWALWQSRCASRPAPEASEPERFRLDPAPALATSREAVVRAGEIREEVLVRASASGASEDRVVARYEDIDCSLSAPLPRRIELEAPAQGWRASVRILEIEENAELDPRLFESAKARSGDAAP